MKESQSQTMPVYPVQYIPSTQDEISLVDIWLTLRRHRKLFLQVAIGVTLLGLIGVLLMTNSYDLRTSLEIGTAVRGDIPTPIESPGTVKAKLDNSLIPKVKNQLNANREEPRKYGINVIIPKKSSIIVIFSKTTKKNEGLYRELHNNVVNAVTRDHARLINVLKKNLQTELALAKITLDEMQDPTTLNALIKTQAKILEDAKADLNALTNPDIFGAKVKVLENDIQKQNNKLASVKDAATVLNQKLEKTGTNQELIQSEVKGLESQIKDAMTMQQESARGVINETHAMAQLMIDSEVQENRKWLAQLKERLFITLEKDKDATHKLLEDNKRGQALQQEKIVEAEANLKAFTGKNLLEQNKLNAAIAQSEAKIAKLVTDQKRSIATQQQSIGKIQAKLDNFVETRAVVEPMLSTEPTSVPRQVILLIIMFLGGILAIAAVFIAELQDKVKLAAANKQHI